MGYTEGQALTALLATDGSLDQALDNLWIQNLEPTPGSSSEDVAGGATAARSPPPAESSEDVCVVCLERPVYCTFAPCGHYCCCYAVCAPRIEQCPVCRANVMQKIRTFRA